MVLCSRVLLFQPFGVIFKIRITGTSEIQSQASEHWEKPEQYTSTDMGLCCFFMGALIHSTHEILLCKKAQVVPFRPALYLTAVLITLTYGLAVNDIEFQPGELSSVLINNFRRNSSL